jgi:hypothetical protein
MTESGSLLEDDANLSYKYFGIFRDTQVTTKALLSPLIPGLDLANEPTELLPF